jgi:pullulanase
MHLKFMKAILVKPNQIRVLVYGPLINHDRESARLRAQFSILETMTLLEEVPQANLTSLLFQLHEPITLGNAYEIIIESFGSVPVDVSEALHFDDFHRDYTYPDDDLGVTYEDFQTTFKLWAPLASAVVLTLNPTADSPQYIPMKRGDFGVYETTVLGDLDGLAYTYDVTNHGVTRTTLDPYAIGSTLNSEASVVINPSRIHAIPHYDEKLPPLTHPTDAIIYEAHVRDLTSDPHTNIVHKGRFLGFLERGKTLQGTSQPVGWDYFTSLGFTHLQLLPVNDYRSVNEHQTDHAYNWGYDPYQYGVIEGSYASDLHDPYSRLLDFKTLVSQCHQAGLRVNLDVVYNHVFEFQYSVFEKVVPGYYFRKRPDGTMSNGSFCGNDVASEKPMVRHLIVHLAMHWVKMFHIDGYRFDLMGIIDQTTMQQISDAIHALRPDFMMYGEGWNMPTELPFDAKTITERHAALPSLSFFNDTFRNVFKGGNFENDILVPGFTTGNPSLMHEAIGGMLGSAYPHLGGYKVSQPYQSINYVECHDNGTFYDKVIRLYPHASEVELQAYIRFSLSVILTAQGIPFLHMGQEVGGTKLGDHNSYKSGDAVNQFRFERIQPYTPVIATLKDLISLRKAFPVLRQPHCLPNHNVQIDVLEEGTFMIHYRWEIDTFTVVVNAQKHSVTYHGQPLQCQLYFDGQKRVDQAFSLKDIPPLSVLFLRQI